jgi:two-component system chemotaxis sensor kinase CheA
LQSVADNLEQYAHINEHTLGRKGPGRRGSADKYLMVDRANLETLIQQLNAYDLQACHHDTLAAALESTRIELGLMGTNSVSSILEGVFDSLPSLAKELNKETPTISVVDNGVFVKNQVSDLLRNVFMHLYRNSMDHGIERPEERLAQGKQATGKILLDVALTPHHLQFRLSDDGKGLALGHIRRKALEKDLITKAQNCTDETVANLIFAAGFSTASKVTEVSGRGVGMDAVQDFVKREGGSIQLVLTDHKVGAEFRSFETVINLPPTFATHSKPQHHAATASAHKASSKRIEPLEFIPAGRNIQPTLA